MYIETRGPTLEEVAKLIDGDDAEIGNVDAHSVAEQGLTSGAQPFEKLQSIRYEHIKLDKL